MKKTVEHSCRTFLRSSGRKKARRGIYRYSLYSTLISILGLSNIENYNFEQLTVIKSVINVVGAREESFGVPTWRCFRSGRWVADGKHSSGFPAVWKIWKEISVKFSQAQHSSYPEHNHWTTSPFFASCHLNRLIHRQGWGETATRNPSRLGLKSLNFWLNCRLPWPYAAFPHQVGYTLSDLPLPRQLSFYTFKRFMPQLSSFSQTEGLSLWEICCAVSQATCFSTVMLWMHTSREEYCYTGGFFWGTLTEYMVKFGAEKLCKTHSLPCHRLSLVKVGVNKLP